MSVLFRRLPTRALVAILSCIAIAMLYIFSNGSAAQSGTKNKTSSKNRNLNISCFVYRDNNRNGQYDMADHPYAGLTINLKRPQGDTVSSRSNISGFANFKMAANNPSEAVHQAGEYAVQAVPETNWEISSNNAKQTLVFELLEQSPAGIIVTETCEPIGVKPVLQISGVIDLEDYDQKNPVLSFTSISPEKEKVDIIVNDEGHYTFPASRGEWTLELISKKNTQVRTVEVNQTAIQVSKIKSVSETENARVGVTKSVGFDDLTTSDTLYEIPNGYGKLNWINWIATHHKFYKGYGYINGTVSSEFMAYNSSGHPASIWSDSPFDFVGVNIAVAWPAGERSDIIIQAWRDDKLVYQDNFRAKTSGSTYFSADYADITKLVFSSETYWQLMIDDFLYQTKTDEVSLN